jgi:glycosyltransferase involved in cell wall biosynthesis
MALAISVLIPVYNGSQTIRATMDSVLKQTVQPDEILVLDDGSTDDTVPILNTYGPRIRVFRQSNRGVGAARDLLCQRARGELIAFIDADDLWHASYLETQARLFSEHPAAVAFFTGHVDFRGYGSYKWESLENNTEGEVISQLEFIRQYNSMTGYFACMSYCCVPKSVLTAIGEEPFRLNGAEDSYLCTTLPLYGPVVYTPSPLVAYRVTNDSLSVKRLSMFESWVRVFELLEKRYDREAGKKLRTEFRIAFASKRRQYGKLLMAADRTWEAKSQFLRAIWGCANPSSAAKSIALLLAALMPSRLQPKWPPLFREGKADCAWLNQ